MKIENVSEEQIEEEMKFIMKIGIIINKYLLDQIVSTFEDHETRSRVLFNFIGNFISNTMNDISEQEHLKSNIQEIFNNINDWIDKKEEGVIYKYDPQSGQVIKKGELH